MDSFGSFRRWPYRAVLLFGIIACGRSGECLCGAGVEISLYRGKLDHVFQIRHPESYRYLNAFHYAVAGHFDRVASVPWPASSEADTESDRALISRIRYPAPGGEDMETSGPRFTRMAWQLSRTVDWTYAHYEKIYDILSDRGIDSNDKKAWIDRAVRFYMHTRSSARSCAPPEITLRRAAVVLKPYFARHRAGYPRSNQFFCTAAWWHAAICEGLAFTDGFGAGREEASRSVNGTFLEELLSRRFLTVPLSRETMPRFSALSPESANIFDNLHLLQSIAFDIVSYKQWSEDEMRVELERVAEATAYRPGDENLAKSIGAHTVHKSEPGGPCDRNRRHGSAIEGIVLDILEETIRSVNPEAIAGEKAGELRDSALAILCPGAAGGETAGSLLDVTRELGILPRIGPELVDPGKTPNALVDEMVSGWLRKAKPGAHAVNKGSGKRPGKNAGASKYTFTEGGER